MTTSKTVIKPIVQSKRKALPKSKGEVNNTITGDIGKQETNMSRKIAAGKRNLEKTKWKKGQSGNPKGRPLKGYSYIIAALAAKGYKKITVQEYNDMNGVMLSLPQAEMAQIGSDLSLPMAWRIKAKEMLSSRGDEQLETIADRIFGKPKQSVSTEMTGSVYVLSSNMDDE